MARWSLAQQACRSAEDDHGPSKEFDMLDSLSLVAYPTRDVR